MRVLYFGTYEREYPRNAQVISCLRGAGVDVVEHHVDVWDRSRHNFRAGPLTASRIALAELRLLARPRTEFDAVHDQLNTAGRPAQVQTAEVLGSTVAGPPVQCFFRTASAFAGLKFHFLKSGWYSDCVE